MTALRRASGRLFRDRRGVTALEFAVIGPLLVLLTLGVVQAGVFGWTEVVLQMTAAQTARCMGIGTSCTSSPTSFAVTMANGWLFPDAVTAANVTLETNVTCNGAPGHYARVTVTSQLTAVSMLPGILGGGLLSAHACYFTGS